MSRAALTSVALLALLGPSASAWAKPRLADLGLLPAMQSDGRRYVSYFDGSWARVSDTQTRTAAAYPRPEGCELYDPLMRLGGGQLMWSCVKRAGGTFSDPDRTYPLLTDLATGSTGPPAGIAYILENQSVYEESSAVFEGIGGRWIYVRTTSGRAGRKRRYIIDWRTGEVRQLPAATATSYRNLDAPQGSQPICEPLERSPDPDSDADDFEFGDADAFLPFRLWGWTALRLDQRESEGPRRLYLERCRRAKRALLAVDPRLFGVGPRAAWWTTAGGVFIRVHRTKRVLRYPLSTSNVAATDTRLYLQRATSPWTTYKTYVVNIPER